MRSLCESFVAFGVIVFGAAAGQSAERGDRSPEVARQNPTPSPSNTQTEKWGIFQGRVTFGGEPPVPRIVADPEEKTIRGMNRHGEVITYSPPLRLKDYEVMAKRGTPITSERLLVDPKRKGVCNTLVYFVKPSGVRDVALKTVPKEIQFRADRGVFVPHVLAAMQRTNILVTTDDSIAYNIDVQIPGTEGIAAWTDSQAEGARIESFRDRLNQVFMKPLVGQRASLEILIGAGEQIPMPVVDAIHPWMSAWWLIIDHPYFAVTDKDGNFTICDVPIGIQEVVVWHESVDPRDPKAAGARVKPEYIFRGKVAIQPDRATVKEFVIEPGRSRP